MAVTIQRASRASHIPVDRRLRAWANAVLPGDAEVTVRYVANAEARRLNREFRGKDYATNVLSFPYAHVRGERSATLGDLAICPAVVAREAREQGKPVRDHFAHLTVHGTLHLIGYDHENERDAEHMEAIERRVLAGLGIPDPYE